MWKKSNDKKKHAYETICTEMNVVHEHLIWLDGTRFEKEEEKKTKEVE